MIVFLIICIIIGAVVSGITGFSLLGWAAGIVIFICGLPGLLISSFIHGENKYAQDRADYRDMMYDLDEEMRHMELLDKLDEINNEPNVYIDNRQIHIHRNSRSRKLK